MPLSPKSRQHANQGSWELSNHHKIFGILKYLIQESSQATQKYYTLFFLFFFKITFALGWTQPTSYLNNLGQRVLKYWQTGKLLSNP